MAVTVIFFGHRECPQSIRPLLREAVAEVMRRYGTTQFYVGNNGQFDACCRSVLKEMGANYAVVLSKIPGKASEYSDCSDTILPEGVAEGGPPRFAIERRNRWMIRQADLVICYVTRQTYGGAAKFVAIAKRQGKPVINLYEAEGALDEKQAF